MKTTILTNLVTLALLTGPAAAQLGGGSATSGGQLPLGDDGGAVERPDEGGPDDGAALVDPKVSSQSGSWQLAVSRLFQRNEHFGRSTRRDAHSRGGSVGPDPSGGSDRPFPAFGGKRSLIPIDRKTGGNVQSGAGGWSLADPSVLAGSPAVGRGPSAGPDDAMHAAQAAGTASGASGKLSDGGAFAPADAGVLGGGSSVLPDGQGSFIDSNGRTIQIDVEPPMTGAAKYGQGFAGTIGVPALSYLGDVTPGNTIQLFAESSSGVATTGYLRVGYHETGAMLRSGLTLLCDTSIALKHVELGASTTAIDFSIPGDAQVHGSAICAQVVMADAGAPGGFAATQGLKLFFQ